MTDKIRNVALVGHGGAGKTALADLLLYRTGANNRLGKVEDGSSLSDYLPEEKTRQHSIRTSVLHFDTEGVRVNLLDTPGYPDFLGDSLPSLASADTALIVINAQAGIGVNTRRMWSAATEAGKARMIVLTRVDGDNVDLDGLLEQIQSSFSEKCIPLTWPDAVGSEFKAVVNTFTGAGATADLQERIAEFGNALREAIVEVDDSLLERFLEDDVSPEEFAANFSKAVAAGTVVPILCTSPTREIGVNNVMWALRELAPSPASLPEARGTHPESGEEQTRPRNAAAPFSGRVFKVMRDPFVGKICFVRIDSGTLKGTDSVYNPRSEKTERFAKMLSFQGKEQTEVAEATAGEIVALSKAETLEVGDTVCIREAPIRYEPVRLLRPMVSLAIEPKSQKDEKKLQPGITQLADEDPTFRFERSAETKELVVSGLTDLHLRLLLERLKERFEVEVDTRAPRIPYRETVTKSAKASYRHKKQTGGRGQFAEVHLEVKPRGRGEGFLFEDDTTGGVIPHNFIPSVEKGVRWALDSGVVAGYPVVDVGASVYFGKAHDVDSSDIAFQIAAREAFKEAAQLAGPSLIEPVVSIEVTIPSRFMGDITGDLSGRRGRIQGTDSFGDMQVIRADVPLSEVATYSTQLGSITGGEGIYTMEFSHYDYVLPGKVAEIKAAAERAREEEKKK